MPNDYKYVVLVGPSGSGKSAIANCLMSRSNERMNSTPEMLSAQSVTKELKELTPVSYDKGNKRFLVQFFDTKGLTDSESSFADEIKTWNSWVTGPMKKLHYVFFVLPPDRLYPSLLKEMVIMMTELVKYDPKVENFKIILNKTDCLNDIAIQRYVQTFRNSRNVPDLFKQAEIIPTSFMNLEDQIPEHLPLCRRLINGSCDLLIETIMKPVSPFTPGKIRDEAIQQRIRDLEDEVQGLKNKCVIL
jgi:hypothetical protein